MLKHYAAPLIYNTAQAARRLGISRDTIYRWMKSGAIKSQYVLEMDGTSMHLWTEEGVGKVLNWMSENYRLRRRKA